MNTPTKPAQNLANRMPMNFPHCVGADLRHRHLSGLDLSGGDFFGADFTGANLAGANLAGADMTVVVFTGASLGSATYKT